MEMVQPTGGYYYLYNGHGDTAWLLDGGGNKVEDYRYDAFGNQTTEESTLYNPFRYNGQYTDEETGLIYLRNRYYDPSIGRFITEDPVRDGLNWYAYCSNNPVAFVDPTGMWMEGDENLSQAALYYIQYYTRLWDEANSRYNEAENNVERIIAERQMNFAHTQANDIRAKDATGEIWGLFYDVPFYSQGDHPYCQEVAAVMIENTGVENPMTKKEAAQRVLEIMEEGWLTREFIDTLQRDEVTYESLYEVLAAYGPQRASFSEHTASGSPMRGHAVVVTGVLKAEGHPDLVIILNPQDKSKGPWGKYRVLTIDEFKNSYAEGIEEQSRLKNPSLNFVDISRNK